MRMVMPTVVPHHRKRWPYMSMARFETGGGGNPHMHGFSMGRRGPRMGRVQADVNTAVDELNATSFPHAPGEVRRLTVRGRHCAGAASRPAAAPPPSEEAGFDRTHWETEALVSGAMQAFFTEYLVRRTFLNKILVWRAFLTTYLVWRAFLNKILVRRIF